MIKIGLCQMGVGDSQDTNLRKAREMICRATDMGANIITLPEMFCCPYDNQKFTEFAEPEGGNAWEMLSNAASDNGVWLVGGSVPELCDGRIYNTSYVFSPDGVQVAKHRKVHLFDIDIPGRQRFKESDTLSPGDRYTLIETEFGRIGVAICFDIRFAELFRLMALDGAEMIFVPGAFNMTTGPAHWELCFRMRALDNQCWTIGCAPARNPGGSYVSYANSLVANPWGEVTARLGEAEAVLVADIDRDLAARVRERIPIMKNRRTDVYELRAIRQE